MALTPEDVLNKQFTATQFKRGYDEQQVDDFLDEIVVELRRLAGELDDCRRSKGLPVQERSATPTEVADDTRADDADERVAAAIAPAEGAEREADERVAAAAARAEQAEREAGEAGESRSRTDENGEPAPAPAAAEPTRVDAAAAAGGAAGVLALAQKVYDEHVAQGEQTRDQLVSEAQTTHDQLLREGQERHDQLISEATAQHDELVADAHQKRSDVLSALDGERERLDRTIQRLHEFEDSYRSKLRGHLEDQLATLDRTVIEDRPDPSLDDEEVGEPETADQR